MHDHGPIYSGIEGLLRAVFAELNPPTRTNFPEVANPRMPGEERLGAFVDLFLRSRQEP